jgi:predicted HicB family RNase H-like nuclease
MSATATHSGKLSLRLPIDMHNTLVLEAERQGVSLNTLIIALLAGAINFTSTTTSQGRTS